MNHNIRLEVINADVECGKGDCKEGERGNVHADKVVGKFTFEDNNEICFAINRRYRRRLNKKLCKINLLFKNYIPGT